MSKRRVYFLLPIITAGLVLSFLFLKLSNSSNSEIQKVREALNPKVQAKQEVLGITETKLKTNTVSIKDGGTLDFGAIQLSFPIGYYSEDLTITYHGLNTDKVTANDQIGPMYELLAKTKDGKEIHKFDKPLTITTSLSKDETAKHDVLGTYFYNVESKKWEKLESRVDADKLFALTDHFTIFTSSDGDPNSSSPQLAATTQSGVIIDNSDPTPYFVPGGAAGGGQPEYFGLITSGYNGDSLFTGNSINSTPHNWATWTADGVTGSVEVFVTIPSGPYIYTEPDEYYGTVLPLTTRATYTITHAGGTDQVSIDQSAFAGGAASLGTFEFNGTGSVYLNDLVPETGDVLLSAIAFDAVSFGGDLTNLDITPPKIEDVKAHANSGTFIIQAKITDEGSGVANASVYFNGALYPMNADGDIYSALIPYSANENLDYYILATDNAGNEAIWQKGRGYVTRGTFAKNLGLPYWYGYSGKSKYKDQCPQACAPGNSANDFVLEDPINPANGNQVDINKLVIIPGRPEIDLHITYNSQGGRETIFGQNWTHSYNYHVLDMDNADYTGAFVQYPDGQVIEFRGDSYEPDAGVFEKLSKTGEGFELLFTNKNKVKFNTDGDITRWEDANGNGIEFSYGQKEKFTLLSQITSIKADGGREVKLNYNGNGHVQEVQAPEGKTLKFEYNSENDLIQIKDGNGGDTKFEYEDHKMTKKVSPKGHNFFVNTYDDQRRVISQTAGTSYKQDFVYSENETVITDANGKVLKYKYNPDKLVVELEDANSKSIKYEYNDQKRIRKMIDRDGNIYEYEYDAKGNQTLEKDPLGFLIRRKFNQEFAKIEEEINKIDDHITKYEYDNNGNLKKITNARNHIRTFDYNSYGQLIKSTDFRGNPTDYTYNSFGDLESETDAYTKSETYNYDGLGRITKLTNKRGFEYLYEYDKNDNLLTYTGPLSYVLKFEYDGNNHIKNATDANGGITKYEYDSSENLISLKNQLDFETIYTYGLMNERIGETDPEGRVTEYINDPIYNITEIKNAVGSPDEISTKTGYNFMRARKETIDPEGRITKFELDPLNRVKKEIKNKTDNAPDSENNVTTEYEYIPTGALVKVKDANGNVTTFELDVLDQVVKKLDAENQETKYEYDEEGNVTKITNPRGYDTNYIYDKLNRLEKIIDAKEGETKFEYDANSNLILSTDANGVKTKFIFNELDRVTDEIQNFVEGGAVDAYTNVKTHYSYDSHGNLTSVVNPRGFETKLVYDPAHRNTQIIDAVGKVTEFTYDKVNNVKQIKDRNEHSKFYEYDNLNRIIKFTNAEGHYDTFRYDKVGNQVEFTNKRQKLFTKQYDPLNRVKVTTDVYSKTQQSTYDPIGNLLTFTDENGHTDKFEYDKIYRLRKSIDAEDIVTEYQYDKNGNIVRKIDGEGNPTELTYDELDRLTNKKNAENEEERYGYDALRNLVMKYEADGTPHKYSYDNIYRLIAVIDNFREGESAANDRNVVTKYQYDANGNLITQINPLNNSTKFEYDELDRLSKETNSLENSWSYSYDFVGNRTKRIDANGATTNYSYYPDDMLQRITYPTYNVDYSYNETNFPTRMTDNLGVTIWDYDDLDRLINQKDPLNRTVAYQYDFVGNITNLKQPDNRSVAHEYFKNDWLKKSKSSDNDQIAFTRNKVGEPLRLDRSNSTYSTVSYDKVYRPLNVHDQQIGSGNHLITDFKYTYNDVGHITNEIAEYGWRQPSRVETNNSYDGLHRLVEAKSSDDQWSKYTYDAAGNRTQMQEYIPNKRQFEVRTSTYNAANQVTKIDIQSPMPPNVLKRDYKYDKNGNRVDMLIKDNTGVDRGIEYSYDFENRLTKSQDYKGEIIKKNPRDTGTYTINKLAHTDLEYDGNGRRLIKTYYSGANQTGKRTEYTFDRLDPVFEQDMWNGQYQNYYRDASQNLMFYQGFKSQQDPKGTIYFYSYDGEGNIAATTKHQGQSDHSYRYDEYGDILPDNGNPASGQQEGTAAGWTAPHNQYTLTQKEYDGKMHLFYFGARHYDPYTGSWITQDAYRGNVFDPMSLHRYMYNYDSPVNYVDKYGFSSTPNTNFPSGDSDWSQWMVSQTKEYAKLVEEYKNQSLKTNSYSFSADYLYKANVITGKIFTPTTGMTDAVKNQILNCYGNDTSAWINVGSSYVMDPSGMGNIIFGYFAKYYLGLPDWMIFGSGDVLQKDPNDSTRHTGSDFPDDHNQLLIGIILAEMGVNPNNITEQDIQNAINKAKIDDRKVVDPYNDWWSSEPTPTYVDDVSGVYDDYS